MKNYVVPELVIHSYDDEVLTADIVRTSLTANEHEETDNFADGWLN